MIYILNSYSKYAIPDAGVAAARVPGIVNHHNPQGNTLHCNTFDFLIISQNCRKFTKFSFICSMNSYASII